MALFSAYRRLPRPHLPALHLGSRQRSALVPALVASAAVLGAMAVYVQARTRQAERDNPPIGKFLTVDGVRLHYTERGEGEPVLLLHGNGAMIQDFEISRVLDMASKKYRVIVFDRPGYGYSERPRSRMWTPSAQADLIHQALKQLGIERPVVVGHSWGTLVAMAMAQAHPLDVKSIVLLSGYFYPSMRADVPMLSAPAIPVIGDLLRHTISPILGWLLASRVVRKVFAPSPVPASFAAFPIDMSMRPSQLRASAEETAFMVPAAAFLARRYKELAMPVVIVAGTGDEIVDFHDQSQRLHEEIHQSSIDPIDDAGHMIHHIAPEHVMAAIDKAATA